MGADGGLTVLHISNIINAIIGWILPWSIVHGIIAIVVMGKLNASDIQSFHKDNGTNGCCLIVASIFSFIWSVLWAIVWFINFFWILPILLGILAVFAAVATLQLMLNR